MASSQDELAQTASKQQHGVQVKTIAKGLFEPQAPFKVYQEVKNPGIFK